jgi:aromatic ring-opening dioxygenase catalytic subunit (LigB family)
MLETGYDHGVFVPLKLVYPEADVPVVAVSLNANLDPAIHIRMGAALATLRARHPGLLIIGSGMATHNLGAMRRSGTGPDDPKAVSFIQ